MMSKNEQCSSSYLLTSYVETAEGHPIGSTRCAKNSLSNSMLDDTTVADDDGYCTDEFEDVIDFCQAAFIENNKTTHCLSTRNVSLPESNVSSVYSRDNACKTIRSIRTEYLNFEKILDRTLVGVYTRTCENKTVCLVSADQFNGCKYNMECMIILSGGNLHVHLPIKEKAESRVLAVVLYTQFIIYRRQLEP